MSIRDRNNTSSDSFRADKADCNAACSSSLRVLRIEHSLWLVNLFSSLFSSNLLRLWLNLLFLFRWLVQLTQQLPHNFEAKQEQFVHQEPACKGTQTTQNRKLVDEKIVEGMNQNTPRKQIEITIKTDERRENAAFRPSTKFISCFSSD
jgi:hypothetical protein